MLISPVTLTNHTDFVKSYDKWKGGFILMQFIPVVSIIGCVGQLTLDAKTWIVNRLFTDNVQHPKTNLSLREFIASETYSQTNSPKGSACNIRLFSVANLLTAGCLGPIVVVVVIAYYCLKSLCECLAGCCN